MGCDPVRVTGYVDHELPSLVAAEVGQHLSVCPACAAQDAFETGLPKLLRLAADVALSPGVERRVLSHTLRASTYC